MLAEGYISKGFVLFCFESSQSACLESHVLPGTELKAPNMPGT